MHWTKFRFFYGMALCASFFSCKGMETLSQPLSVYSDDEYLYLTEKDETSPHLNAALQMGLNRAIRGYDQKYIILNEAVFGSYSFESTYKFFIDATPHISISEYVEKMKGKEYDELFLIYKGLNAQIRQNPLLHNALLDTCKQSSLSLLYFYQENETIYGIRNTTNNKFGRNYVGQLIEKIRADLIAERLVEQVISLVNTYKKQKNPSIAAIKNSSLPGQFAYESTTPLLINGIIYPSFVHYYWIMAFGYATKNRSDYQKNIFQLDSSALQQYVQAHKKEIAQNEWQTHQLSTFVRALLTNIFQNRNLEETINHIASFAEQEEILHLSYKDKFFQNEIIDELSTRGYILLALRNLLKKNSLHELISENSTISKTDALRTENVASVQTVTHSQQEEGIRFSIINIPPSSSHTSIALPIMNPLYELEIASLIEEKSTPAEMFSLSSERETEDSLQELMIPNNSQEIVPYTFNTECFFTFQKQPYPSLTSYLNSKLETQTLKPEDALIPIYKIMSLQLTSTEKIAKAVIATYPHTLIYRHPLNDKLKEYYGVNEKNEGSNFIGQLEMKIRAALLAYQLESTVVHLVQYPSILYKNKDNSLAVSLKDAPQNGLSFHTVPILAEGVRFLTLAHYYAFHMVHTSKWNDEDAYEKNTILQTILTSPELTRIKNKVKSAPTWEQDSKTLLARALLIVFLQHPQLQNELIKTEGKYLTVTQDGKNNYDAWLFKDNFFGHLLMAVRRLLKEKPKDLRDLALREKSSFFLTNTDPISNDNKQKAHAALASSNSSSTNPKVPIAPQRTPKKEENYTQSTPIVDNTSSSNTPATPGGIWTALSSFFSAIGNFFSGIGTSLLGWLLG